jgi:predicted HTH transcriptional regulator
VWTREQIKSSSKRNSTKKSMKIKIPISWHFDIQEEKEVVVDIPEPVVKEVLISFLMHKDYDARQDWLIKNGRISITRK